MIPTPTNTENLLPDSCSASVMAFVCSSTWRLIPTIPIQVPHMGRCIVLAPKDCPVSLGTTGSQPTCLPVSAVVSWVKVTCHIFSPAVLPPTHLQTCFIGQFTAPHVHRSPSSIVQWCVMPAWGPTFPHRVMHTHVQRAGICPHHISFKKWNRQLY